MFWRSAAALSLALASLFDGAQSNIITITEHASVCRAVYTTGSKSVTVVQSTVTVKPVPWTDSAANSGTPFVLEVQFGSAPTRKRTAQGPFYLTADGNTTIDSTQATQYTIISGQLSSTNGRYISTTPGTLNQPFAVLSTLESISTTFAVQNSGLVWSNSAFDNGVVTFFSTPAGVFNNAQIIVRFSGAIDPSWSAIAFLAIPGVYKMQR